MTEPTERSDVSRRPLSSSFFNKEPTTNRELVALILLVASIASAVLGWVYQSDKLGTVSMVCFVLSICFKVFPDPPPFSFTFFWNRGH